MNFAFQISSHRRHFNLHCYLSILRQNIRPEYLMSAKTDFTIKLRAMLKLTLDNDFDRGWKFYVKYVFWECK